jgi:hypothetical protein
MGDDEAGEGKDKSCRIERESARHKGLEGLKGLKGLKGLARGLSRTQGLSHVALGLLSSSTLPSQ